MACRWPDFMVSIHGLSPSVILMAIMSPGRDACKEHRVLGTGRCIQSSSGFHSRLLPLEKKDSRIRQKTKLGPESGKTTTLSNKATLHPDGIASKYL